MNVAVVIITYKRPDGLRKLLHALVAQDLSDLPAAVEQLNIVVVDNDPKGSAAQVVSEFHETGCVHFTCLSEPQPGIPFARNRGMLHAIEKNDFFAFIDDDEYPTTCWLSALLKITSEMRSDAVLGPVIPVFPEGTPRWICNSRVFEGWKFPDRTRIFEAATNNVLVRSSFVRQYGIRFDERMQACGGSDYRFFRQCIEAGMVIRWSSEAAVFEDIPRSRTRVRWMAQRQVRLGNTFAVDARLSGRLSHIAALYAIGLMRIVYGLFAWPLLLVSRRWGTNALIHLLRGFGIVSGVHGYRHDEYATVRLEQERQVA